MPGSPRDVVRGGAGRVRRSRCGAAMAGVFDIDLETEEGSDGEEPELGAVSRAGGWRHDREPGTGAAGIRDGGTGTGGGQRGPGPAGEPGPVGDGGAGGTAGTGGTGTGWGHRDRG